MMARIPFKLRHISSPTVIELKSLILRSFKDNGRLLLWNQTQSYSDDSESSTEDTSNLEKKRKAFFGRKRQLSPSGRVTGMIEQDKEDRTLGNQKQEFYVLDDEFRQTRSSNEKVFSESNIDKCHHELTANKDSSYLDLAKNQRTILIDREFVYVVMENIKTNVHLKEMFLLEAGRRFHCRYGSLNHTDIVGHLPGKVFLTDKGVPVLVRRPTLEEYVLHMKRTATISYPKDCSAMLMMIDVCPGDDILEAGTGSGAMTLHLSRAVWTAGTIHTFEANSSHQKVAKTNIQAWKQSYNISHCEHPWPTDNIHFHFGHLQDTKLNNDSVDAAVIDLEDPHLAIQTVSEKLKRGKSAAIYVSNLSQVVDVTEVIRIKQLPLLVDDIIDVTHKHWLVHPARRRQGISALDRLKVQRGSEISLEESHVKDHSLRGKEEGYLIDHVPKYITRPRHKQPSFTAFLVKLTKVLLTDLKHKI